MAMRFQRPSMMPPTSFLAAGLASLLVSGSLAAGGPATDAIGFGHELRQVAPRVHVLAQREPFHVQPLGNVTLFRQSDGWVVVDAGGTPAAGRRVADVLQALGPEPLKALVITHWHADHALGAAQLLDRWPKARLISTRHTRDAMRDGLAPFRDPGRLAEKLADVAASYRAPATDASLAPDERAGFARTVAGITAYAAQFDDGRIRLPTEFVEDRRVLDDPLLPLVVFHPGAANTPGDLVVHAPRERIMAVGDIVVAPVPFAFDASPVAWAGVLGRLADKRPHLLIPGHGAPLHGTTYLDRLADWLCEAHARIGVGPEGVADATLEDQVEEIARGNPWLRRWARAYWADPLARSVRDEQVPVGEACPPIARAGR